MHDQLFSVRPSVRPLMRLLLLLPLSTTVVSILSPFSLRFFATPHHYSIRALFATWRRCCRVQPPHEEARVKSRGSATDQMGMRVQNPSIVQPGPVLLIALWVSFSPTHPPFFDKFVADSGFTTVEPWINAIVKHQDCIGKFCKESGTANIR